MLYKLIRRMILPIPAVHYTILNRNEPMIHKLVTTGVDPHIKSFED